MSELLFSLTLAQVMNPGLMLQALVKQGASLDSVIWLGFISNLRDVFTAGTLDSAKLDSAIGKLDSYLSDYRQRESVITRTHKGSKASKAESKTGKAESAKAESAMGFQQYAKAEYKLTDNESRAVYDAFEGSETLSECYERVFANHKRLNNGIRTKTAESRLRKAVSGEWKTRKAWLTVGYTGESSVTPSASVESSDAPMTAESTARMIEESNARLLASIAALLPKA